MLNCIWLWEIQIKISNYHFKLIRIDKTLNILPISCVVFDTVHWELLQRASKNVNWQTTL